MIEGHLVSALLRAIDPGGVAARALDALGRRHDIEVSKDILDERVRLEFARAVETAMRALVGSIVWSVDSIGLSLGLESQARLEALVRSPEMSEEISKLLDPGVEVFDDIRIGAMLADRLPEDIPLRQREQIAEEALEAMFRAYSFASRSLPYLREFLRASYEVGSFRALTNISGLLGMLDSSLNTLGSEGRELGQRIALMRSDLEAHREWLHAFEAH